MMTQADCGNLLGACRILRCSTLSISIYLMENCMKRFAQLFLGLFACVSLGTFAFAAVSYDPLLGGFVGKGDIQSKLKWTNAELQANAKDISFAYYSKAKFSVTCTWTNVTGKGETKVHSVTKEKKLKVDSLVDFDTKENRKLSVTGWFLFPLDVDDSFDFPEVGDRCPNGNNGTITDVKWISGTSPTLEAIYKDRIIPLPNTL
jgi:hypothetical protein